MYTENEKISFANRITALAQKTDMPYRVCMALQGKEAKILLLKEFLLPEINKDLSDLSSSFLYNEFVEHVNIDANTGKVTDYEIPYDYVAELRSSYTPDRLAALQKVLRGITGSSIFFGELEISDLSKRNIAIIVDYIFQTILSRLLEVCMSEALKIVDPEHILDLKEGAFYVKPGTKHLRALWVLKYLNIKSVVLPYGVTVIRPYAFENTDIENVTFSRTVSHIHRGAFLGCNLKKLHLPENKFLTELGIDSFGKNLLEEIAIPKNITSLDFYAFRKNPLVTVTVTKGTKVLHAPKRVDIKEE